MKIIKSLLRITSILLMVIVVFAYLFRFEKHEFSNFIEDQTGIVLFEPEYLGLYNEQEQNLLKSGEKNLNKLQNTIKDKALFQCLTDTGITHVDKFRSINCPKKGIKSIEGLNELRYVSKVDLSGNEITEVYLSKLPNLRTLDVSDNKITQFTAERTLFLNEVNLSGNQISYIKTQRTINYLNLSNNQLTELPDLRAKYANLQENFIEKISMDFSPYIRTLDLRRNKIKTITDYNRRSSVIPVIPSHFRKVNKKSSQSIQIKPLVLLAHNPIDKIDSESLKTINVDVAAISPDESILPDEALRACLEFQPVIKIEELVQLNCSGKTKEDHLKQRSKITNIEGLSYLYAVKSIDFSHNSLMKANLSGLKNLEAVNFESNQLKTVIWPKEHRIKTLNLAHNELEYLVLDGFDHLKNLNLSANRLIYFDYPIAKLEVFNIDRNPIERNKNLQSDLSQHGLNLYDDFLTTIPDGALSICIAAHLISNGQSPQELAALNCWDYEIESFDGLEKLTGLKSLTLNKIDEVPFDFSVFSKLNELTLRGARIEQLRLNNPELYKLSILSSEIDVLNLFHNYNLLEIQISNSQIKIMDLPRNRHAEPYYFNDKILIDESKIGHLNLPTSCQFNELTVSNGQLSKLKIPDSCAVEKLTVHRSGLREFLIGEKVLINMLNLQGNQLKNLDILKLQGLTQLKVSGNKLASLTLPLASTEIKRLEIAQNPVPLSEIKMQTMPHEIIVSEAQYDVGFSMKYFFYHAEEKNGFYMLKKDNE